MCYVKAGYVCVLTSKSLDSMCVVVGCHVLCKGWLCVSVLMSKSLASMCVVVGCRVLCKCWLCVSVLMSKSG